MKKGKTKIRIISRVEALSSSPNQKFESFQKHINT